MKCECGEKMMEIQTFECPKCGKKLNDYRAVCRLEKRKLAIRDKKRVQKRKYSR